MSENVLILVLGDAGRSPRMQYHALSLLQSGSACDSVCLMGYPGSPLISALDDPKFTFLPIPQHPQHPIFTSIKPLKALFQLFALLTVLLFRRPRPDVLLLQLPPAIPTMLCVLLVCWVRRIRLVFDWHNFGWTLMPAGPLQSVARWYEKILAPCADANLCVTKSMQTVLRDEYRGTRASVFYDRPKSDVFNGRTGVHEGVALLNKLMEVEKGEAKVADWERVIALLEGMIARMQGTSRSKETAPSTREEVSPGCKITARRTAASMTTRTRRRTNVTRSNRTNRADENADFPVMIVSSTSWTWDEDFSILLEGMVAYDAHAVSDASLPPILLYVTGKGPLKQFYIDKISKLDLLRVAIRTVWLEPGDYPKLLGCADLGVSLHASSSGVDLPMKIVDMFGAQTPVAALSYPCLADEMVADGKNGVLFGTGAELCDKLMALLRGGGKELERMQRYVQEHGYGNWDDEWNRKAKKQILMYAN